MKKNISRTIWLVVIIATILAALIFTLAFSANYSKNMLKAHLKTEHGIDLAGECFASIEWKPMPHLLLNAATLNYNSDRILHAQQIRLPLMKLYLKSEGKIEFTQGVLNIDTTTQFLDKKERPSDATLNIALHDIGIFSTKLPHVNKLTVDNASVQLDSRNIKTAGSLINEFYTAQFSAHVNLSSHNINLKYSTPGLNFEIYKKKSAGKTKITVYDAEKAISSLGNIIGAWDHDSINHKYTKTSPLKSKPLIIESNLQFKSASHIIIDNFQSNNPKAISPYGQIVIRNGAFYGSLATKRLNIKHIFRTDIQQNSIPNIIADISKHLTIPIMSGSHGMITLKAGDIVSHGKRIIQPRAVIAKMHDLILLEEIKGEIVTGKNTSGTKFNLSGTIREQNGINKLQSTINIVDADRATDCQANLTAGPSVTLIDRVSGYIENAKIFNSSIKTVATSKLRAKHHVNLRIQNAKIGAERHIQNIITKLYYSDLDNTGDAYFDSFKNHMWLRTLNSDWEINAKAVQVSIGDRDIKAMHLKTKLEKNIADVEAFYINSNDMTADLNGSFILLGLKPNITLRGKIIQADFPKLHSLLPSHLTLANRVRKIFPKLQFNHHNFNLFSLNHHDIKGDITIENATLNDDIKVKDVELIFTSQDSIIDIKKIKADMADHGRILSAGTIATYDSHPELNLKTKIRSINAAPLFSGITSIDKLQGYISANTTIYTKGRNTADMIENMVAYAQILGSDMRWSGFNSTKIINAIDSKKMNIAKKTKALNDGLISGTTIFSKLKGNINIKNGIASSNNIQFSNNRISGSCAMHYRFSDKAIRAVSKITFIPQNSNYPIGFTIQPHGYLPDYQVSYDTNQIAQYLQGE